MLSKGQKLGVFHFSNITGYCGVSSYCGYIVLEKKKFLKPLLNFKFIYSVRGENSYFLLIIVKYMLNVKMN